jgi:hypothetical protein
MPSLRSISGPSLLAVALLASGCALHRQSEPLGVAETFHWVSQPIAFSPPPSRWYREGDNGGGKLGVRFILRDGGGQCISVAAYRLFAERDHRDDLTRLAGRLDSLSQRELLNELSRVRAQTDDPLTEREGAAALTINAALERAVRDELEGGRAFVTADLDEAVRTARSYQPTLEELLPRLLERPERGPHPEDWHLGRQRDTVWAGQPAYACDDTLVIPEQTLLYHQIFWVVNGCAFDAIFQGREENLATFHRVVDSISFPNDASR